MFTEENHGNVSGILTLNIWIKSGTPDTRWWNNQDSVFLQERMPKRSCALCPLCVFLIDAPKTQSTPRAEQDLINQQTNSWTRRYLGDWMFSRVRQQYNVMKTISIGMFWSTNMQPVVSNELSATRQVQAGLEAGVLFLVSANPPTEATHCLVFPP